nr:MAG TPA: hypothetical protein [Caudoviricetes sp.]
MFSWNQPGRYERGQWQPGARVEREIEASVQPMSMQDIADMPEGERHGQMVKTYFDDDSVPIHQFGQGRIELTHGGFQWVVISDEWHAGDVINHRKVIARRVVTETRE